MEKAFTSNYVLKLYGRMLDKKEEFGFIFLIKDIDNQKENKKIDCNYAILCSKYNEYNYILENEKAILNNLNSAIIINSDSYEFGYNIEKKAFDSIKKSIEDSKIRSAEGEERYLFVYTKDKTEISKIKEKLFNNDDKIEIKIENDNIFKVKKNINQMIPSINNQKRAIDVMAVILILSIMMNIATVIKLQTQNNTILCQQTIITNLTKEKKNLEKILPEMIKKNQNQMEKIATLENQIKTMESKTQKHSINQEKMENIEQKKK